MQQWYCSHLVFPSFFLSLYSVYHSYCTWVAVIAHGYHVKPKKKFGPLRYAHTRGAVAELRLARDLIFLQGSGRIEASRLNSHSYKERK